MANVTSQKDSPEFDTQRKLFRFFLSIGWLYVFHVGFLPPTAQRHLIEVNWINKNVFDRLWQGIWCHQNVKRVLNTNYLILLWDVWTFHMIIYFLKLYCFFFIMTKCSVIIRSWDRRDSLWSMLKSHVQ